MQLLTRKEVATILKISEATIIRMEKRGELKRVKIAAGKKALYDSEDLEALIQASKESNDK